MDPNQAWETVRSYLDHWRLQTLTREQLENLHEAAKALHGWLLGGGFRPDRLWESVSRNCLVNLLECLLSQIILQENWRDDTQEAGHGHHGTCGTQSQTMAADRGRAVSSDGGSVGLLVTGQLLKINALQATERKMQIKYQGAVRGAWSQKGTIMMGLVVQNDNIPSDCRDVLPYVEVFEPFVKEKDPKISYSIISVGEPQELYLMISGTNLGKPVLVPLGRLVEQIENEIKPAAPIWRPMPGKKDVVADANSG